MFCLGLYSSPLSLAIRYAFCCSHGAMSPCRVATQPAPRQPEVVGLIGAALVLGAVFGAGFGGPVADRLGRKRLMLADMVIIGIGAATSALANGPIMLFVGQLLVGAGVGIDFPVSSTYISEVSPKRSRARMMVATLACQSG